jgi:hypothetical protein
MPETTVSGYCGSLRGIVLSKSWSFPGICIGMSGMMQ